MAAEPLDADATVRAEFERQVAELKQAYAAAETRRQRRQIRRKVRRLRKHLFGRGVVRW